MKSSLGALLGSTVLACGALLGAMPAQALTINPIFGTPCKGCAGVSLASDPAAEAAITAAAQQIESQFSNDLTVNIEFYGAHRKNSFLGESDASLNIYTYSQYTAALRADAALNPSNAILNTAVANLGSGNGAGDPSALILATTANSRALGLGTSLTGGPMTAFDSQGADGVVYINLSEPFSFSRPPPDVTAGVTYDAQTTMEHEIDEILGVGGYGSELNDFNSDPNYAKDYYGVNGTLLGPLDLYRYSAPGTPSFDPTTDSVTGCTTAPCSGDPSPYFSVDGGVTSIDTFNQQFPQEGGDAGDWGVDLSTPCAGGGFGGSGDVQDAFACNNHAADVKPGTPSFKSLEAVGYNPDGVPEPAAWSIMLIGFGGLGAALRSRRRHGFAATT